MPPRGKPAGWRGAAVSADNLLPPLQKDLNVVLNALSTSDCAYLSRLMPEQQQSCMHPTKKKKKKCPLYFLLLFLCFPLMFGSSAPTLHEKKLQNIPCSENFFQGVYLWLCTFVSSFN